MCAKDEYDKYIIGDGIEFTSDSSVTGLNNNLIVVGSSGCGKTKSISEPRIITSRNSSLICTLTKRKLVDQYRYELEKRGYEVEELNFVNPEQGDVCFDPFGYLKRTADVDHLAGAIIEAGGGSAISSDPFWTLAGKALLSAEIEAIRRCGKPTLEHFMALFGKLKILSGGDELIKTTHDKLFEHLGKLEDTEFLMNCWNTFRASAMKTAASIYVTASAYVSGIFTEELVRASKVTEQVDITSLGKRKKALFVVTSPVNESMHRYVNLFYGQVFKELFEFAESRPDGELPVPVHILCDDFATGGRVQSFPDYISIFREKGISVTLLLQSESQLASTYGENGCKTIINNCDTYVFMGGMDVDTCRSLSIKMDVPIGDVLYLPVGKEYILRRGQKPILADRYDIYNDKTYILTKRIYDEKIREKTKREKNRRIDAYEY